MVEQDIASPCVPRQLPLFLLSMSATSLCVFCAAREQGCAGAAGHYSTCLQATACCTWAQVDSEGRKFGKSTGGAIWLSSAMLSPYKFYQYLFNTADADVVKFLKMLTFIPLEDISTVEASMSDPTYVPNTAQKRLAEEVTRFVHGEEGLKQALRTTQVMAAALRDPASPAQGRQVAAYIVLSCRLPPRHASSIT